MAPDPESVYFPLEKCLNGDHSIISWKTALYAISDDQVDSSNPSAALKSFFADNEVQNLLINPFDAFPAPSAQTKSSFEQKTSAINVTPSANFRYDLRELKADASWLSEAVSVDQVSALRVAVVECQNRANTQLLGPLTEGELAGIREASGSNQFSTPTPFALLSHAADPEDISQHYGLESTRRKRLLDTYLLERNSFLATFNAVVQAARLRQARGSSEMQQNVTETTVWRESLGLDIINKLAPITTALSRGFEFVRQTLKYFETGCGGFASVEDNDEIDLPWGRAQLTQIIHGLELIFDLTVSCPHVLSSKNVLEWFEMLNTYDYFSHLDTEDPTMQSLHANLQTLTSLISLAILKLAQTIDTLGDTQSPLDLIADSADKTEQYYLNKETIYRIQALMQTVAEKPVPIATAGPAMLGWTALINFLRLRVSDVKSAITEGDGPPQPAVEYEDVLEQIYSRDVQDPVDALALKAVNECRVFDLITGISQHLGAAPNTQYAPVQGARTRLILLDLLHQTTMIGYLPEVVEALISILRGSLGYWEHVIASVLPPSLDVVLAFFNQEELSKAFLQNAMSRYPFESAPFLQLVQALAASPSTYRAVEEHPLLEFLQKIPVFTHQLPENFREYETIQEEDNNNNIQLLQPVELFANRTKTTFSNLQSHSNALATIDADFTIAAKTHGRIVSDSGPRIVLWFHEYSALKYFGKLLETYLAASNIIDMTIGRQSDRETVSTILEIFASLLFGLSKKAASNESPSHEAVYMLETASSGLSRNRDIITVVFDIFEEELQRISANPGAEVPLDILNACIHFTHALLPIFPRRVWPMLSQTKLISGSRGGGRLGVIVEAVELAAGKYEFLLSCSYLYRTAVEEMISNVVRRRVGNRISARYTEETDMETGVSDQILSSTLLLFTRYFVDALEGASTWKFVDVTERRQLIQSITSTFDNVLQSTYGIVDAAGGETEVLMKALAPSASVIAENFLSSTTGSLRFQSFLQAFHDGLISSQSTTFRAVSNATETSVKSALKLPSTLLKTGTLFNRTTTQLETLLFQSSPLIARLYGSSPALRTSVLDLLGAMILAATNHAQEPPSLLAYLGSHTSRNFIQALANIDQPLSRTKQSSRVWRFLSVVVSNRQQWFSNYLLTGKTPRAALQKVDTSKDVAHIERPFLTTVLSRLTSIKSLPQAEVMNMLKFMALAQNFWPWNVYSSSQYENFMNALLDYIGNMSPLQQSKDQTEPIYQTRIAAYIGELVAMYLFHSRQTAASISFKTVEDNLEYFTRFATEIPSYNPSLHSNLKQNFAKRYNGVRLHDFQRTSLENRELGTGYFYDQILTERILSFDAGWNGKRNDGMRKEIALANLNLSLVDAQIALFQSWRVLAIELSNRLSTSEKLHELLANIANKCIIANSRPQPSEEIFSSLCQTRAELALILAQRLVPSPERATSLKQLVNHVWDNIRSLRGSFERSLEDAEMSYYRTLLRLLYLALRVHTGSGTGRDSSKSSMLDAGTSSLITTVLDIVKHVVAIGIRELASSLHSASARNGSASLPEDLSLITGILQIILRIPQIDLQSATLVNIFSMEGTARVATTLYSWSDTLAVNGDPIYGELSLLFLVELSSIQPMAEQMAIEGVLGQIAAANITNYLRSGQVGPFVESAGGQRCYGAWVRGILPFLLNLLDSVQIPIASEISLFLSQFPNLLSQSAEALDTPETNRLLAKGQSKFVTLASCTELHSLSLIYHILSAFKREIGGEGIVDLEWDAAGVSENAEWWLSTRAILRERIVPIGDKEVEWSRRKSKDGEASLLEDKVVAELEGVRSVLSSRD